MATNFWASSHCKALCTREALLASHSADRAKGLTADQVQQLTIFHVQCVAQQHLLPSAPVSYVPMRSVNVLSCDIALQIYVT